MAQRNLTRIGVLAASFMAVPAFADDDAASSAIRPATRPPTR
ncbi:MULTISPECIES: hypothetical protein [Thiomonas]|nr:MULTISPECIES: hypothetical protein [Thiomonas]